MIGLPSLGAGYRSAVNVAAFGGYQSKVLGLSPAGYWPLTETSGVTVFDVSGNGLDGTSDGVTVGDAPGPIIGTLAHLYDGVNDRTNVPHTTIDAVINKSEGALGIWIKAANVGVWSDGANRAPVILAADGNNRILLQKSSTTGTFFILYDAGGTTSAVTVSSLSTTDWLHIAITWSVSDDEVIAYIDGSQSGSTQTTLGTWAGALDADLTLIGAGSKNPIVNPWDGWLAQVVLFDYALTAEQVLSLATIN